MNISKHLISLLIPVCITACTMGPIPGTEDFTPQEQQALDEALIARGLPISNTVVEDGVVTVDGDMKFQLDELLSNHSGNHNKAVCNEVNRQGNCRRPPGNAKIEFDADVPEFMRNAVRVAVDLWSQVGVPIQVGGTASNTIQVKRLLNNTQTNGFVNFVGGSRWATELFLNDDPAHCNGALRNFDRMQQIAIHEIGHTFGLRHPIESNGTRGPIVPGTSVVRGVVMEAVAPCGFSPTVLQPDDIAGAKHIFRIP